MRLASLLRAAALAILVSSVAGCTHDYWISSRALERYQRIAPTGNGESVAVAAQNDEGERVYVRGGYLDVDPLGVRPVPPLRHARTHGMSDLFMAGVTFTAIGTAALAGTGLLFNSLDRCGNFDCLTATIIAIPILAASSALLIAGVPMTAVGAARPVGEVRPRVRGVAYVDDERTWTGGNPRPASRRPPEDDAPAPAPKRAPSERPGE